MKSADGMNIGTGDERHQPLAESLILPFVAVVGLVAMSIAGLAIAV